MSSSAATRRKAASAAALAKVSSRAYKVMRNNVPICGLLNSKRWRERPGDGERQAARRNATQSSNTTKAQREAPHPKPEREANGFNAEAAEKSGAQDRNR